MLREYGWTRGEGICLQKQLREQVPDIPGTYTPHEKGQLESILTGSLRLNDRLVHTGIQATPTKFCSKCKQQHETSEHIFWQCSASCYAEIREKYVHTIHELAAECRPNFLQYVPFRTCGLIPECDALTCLDWLQEPETLNKWESISEEVKQAWL